MDSCWGGEVPTERPLPLVRDRFRYGWRKWKQFGTRDAQLAAKRRNRPPIPFAYTLPFVVNYFSEFVHL